MLAKMSIADIESKLKQGKISIAVVGAGRIGLPTAVLFANAGAKVTACDVRPEVVKWINEGRNYIDEPGLDELFKNAIKTGHLKASRNAAKVMESADVAILCVPTPVSEVKVPVYDYILSAAKAVGEGLQAGSLVIVESTISPGTMEEEIIPVIEKASKLKAGIDFLAASCPERADPGSIITRYRETPRVVGGVSKRSAEIAAALYKPLADVIVTVSSAKAANAVKLTENIFRDVNIALMNELAILYERLGIDIFEVIEAASSKWTFLAHYPGAGVGGPCLPANAYYLIGEGQKAGYVPYLIRMSREINDRMPSEVVRQTMAALNTAGKSLKESRIAILGATYKPGVKDAQNSPAISIISEFTKRGAKVSICDPLIAGSKILQHSIIDSVVEAAKDADCLVVVTAHEEFKQLNLEKIGKITASPLVIVDGRGIFRKSQKPKGAIYIGIGIPLTRYSGESQ
jgi:nucleotide sugar dehydrogenase